LGESSGEGGYDYPWRVHSLTAQKLPPAVKYAKTAADSGATQCNTGTALALLNFSKQNLRGRVFIFMPGSRNSTDYYFLTVFVNLYSLDRGR